VRDTQFAKFSDQTIINNISSKRFSYAWLVTGPHCIPSHGFSSRRDLAEKRAKQSASKILSRMDRLEKYCQSVARQGNEQRKNWAERKLSRVSEVRDGIRTEIVEVMEPSSVEIINHLVCR
tara:strand:+ start:12976 stop:13338 length:363 start_codon:yes stop_codon:yes gene_type:complete